MARGTPPRVAIYRRHAANDTAPSSLAAQEAALRSYLAAHPDWQLIPTFDSDGRRPFNRPWTTRRHLPASRPDKAATTDRPATARRHRRQ